MAANCAGIVGAQLFRSDDLPYYHRGWSVIAGLMSFTLALAIILIVLYYQSNANMKKSGIVAEEMSEAPLDAASEKPKLFNY